MSEKKVSGMLTINIIKDGDEHELTIYAMAEDPTSMHLLEKILSLVDDYLKAKGAEGVTNEG